MEGENREGEAVLELYDEGEGLPQQKLKLSAVGKHISLTKQTIDGQAQLSKDFKSYKFYVLLLNYFLKPIIYLSKVLNINFNTILLLKYINTIFIIKVCNYLELNCFVCRDLLSK